MAPIICPQCHEQYQLSGPPAVSMFRCGKCGRRFAVETPGSADSAVRPQAVSGPIANVRRASGDSALPSPSATASPAPGEVHKTRSIPLEEVAFRLTATGVEPPAGGMTPGQREFLAALERGRRDNLKLRARFLSGVGRALPADPVEQTLAGWSSLAVLFDWEAGMDSMYGLQIFREFLHRVSPEVLKNRVVLHFGDLFDNYCAVVARSESKGDLQAIADAFNTKDSIPGLLPLPTRYLIGPVSDGHLLARTFSLPLEAALQDGAFRGDNRGGLGRYLTSDFFAGTKWRLLPPGVLDDAAARSRPAKEKSKLSAPLAAQSPGEHAEAPPVSSPPAAAAKVPPENIDAIRAEFAEAKARWRNAGKPYLILWPVLSVLAGVVTGFADVNQFAVALVVGTIAWAVLLPIPLVIIFRLRNNRVVLKQMELGAKLADLEKAQSKARLAARSAAIPPSSTAPVQAAATTMRPLCPDCGGNRLWTIVEALGLQPYCLDCTALCDQCGARGPRKTPAAKSPAAACSRCKAPFSSESDEDRVSQWIDQIKKHGGNPRLIELLGRIGPAGRRAIPMLTAVYNKHGKGDFTGCAAFDALREHKMNSHVS